MYQSACKEGKLSSTMENQCDSHDDLSIFRDEENKEETASAHETSNQELGFIKSILNNGDPAHADINHGNGY